MNEIIPSVPFKKFEDIIVFSEQAKKYIRKIQIDICDGVYVENLSWPYTEFSESNFINQAKNNDVYLPSWEDIDYQADLMVEKPEKIIETLAIYGFVEIIVHFRSIEGREEAFKIIKEIVEKYELNLYLAIDLKTDYELFFDFLKQNKSIIKGVEVMGILNIGKQGEEFDERCFEIIKKIKDKFDILVQVDGGIIDENIFSLKEAGVDVFCVGHFLGNKNFNQENFKILKDIIQ